MISAFSETLPSLLLHSATSKLRDDIAQRLLSVNQDVLQNIAKRMLDGEMVQPVTDDKKACF
jgi:hypothetical protein